MENFSSTHFLKRHILSPDNHAFVGRIYDIGIVEMHFDTYEELAQYIDCKYAFDTNYWVSSMITRIESLNLAGSMFWPDPLPTSFEKFPITSYEWLTVATDVFLTRYASVIDCLFLTINQIFQLDLSPKQCTYDRLKKNKIPKELLNHLKIIIDSQETIRSERNSRIHHGQERAFTDDDLTFRIAARFQMTGSDQYGRPVDVKRFFKEGLIGLQREFNKWTRLLEIQLNALYDLLLKYFNFAFNYLSEIRQNNLLLLD